MRGLTIVVAEAAPARLRTALAMALTTRALGGQACLFLDAAAVALLADPSDEAEPIAAGLPTQATLIREAAEAGVELVLCQTGLALHNLSADRLGSPWQAGGLVGVMAGLGDDRLVIA